MTRTCDLSRRALPLHEWPEGDQRAWQTAVAEGDVLDGRGSVVHWAPRTKKTNIQHYGRWLGYLAWTGQLDPSADPGARITIEVIGTYNRHLEKIVSPRTRLSMLVGLKVTIEAMAPKKNWRWLQDICNRVQRNAKPKRDRLHDVSINAKLYVAAHGILRAMAGKVSTMTEAVRFRDGLMLALLCARPVRVKNFTGITLGNHLTKRDNEWCLDFPAAEVKNRQSISFFFPEDLVEYLEYYIQSVRPYFPDAQTSMFLWLGQDGAKHGNGFLYYRITKLTKKLTGKSVNPHLFRHGAATLMAMESPAMAELSTSLLAHRHTSTTKKFYIMATNLEASRKMNYVLESVKNSPVEE